MPVHSLLEPGPLLLLVLIILLTDWPPLLVALTAGLLGARLLPSLGLASTAGLLSLGIGSSRSLSLSLRFLLGFPRLLARLLGFLLLLFFLIFLFLQFLVQVLVLLIINIVFHFISIFLLGLPIVRVSKAQTSEVHVQPLPGEADGDGDDRAGSDHMLGLVVNHLGRDGHGQLGDAA